MLFFSLLCLLNAGQSLPMVPVARMLGVFKTQNPPPKIVGFSNTPNQEQARIEAGQYAYTLDKYQTTTTSGKITTLASPLGKFQISSYEFIKTGWMIRHKDQSGQNFVSYVISTVTSWELLRNTIDATLQHFMDGYSAAYSSTPIIKPDAADTIKQLLNMRTKNAEDLVADVPNLPTASPNFLEDTNGMKQALSCYASLKIIINTLETQLDKAVDTYKRKKNISDERVRALYTIHLIPLPSSDPKYHQEQNKLKHLKNEQEITEEEILDFAECGKYIIDLKRCLLHLNKSPLQTQLDENMKSIWLTILDQEAKKRECFACDTRDYQKLNRQCIDNASDEDLLAYCNSSALFFKISANGAWGDNNCFFASIGQTAGALEKIITKFTNANTYLSRGQTWETDWKEGGRILRNAVFTAFEEEKDLTLVEDMCCREDAIKAQEIKEMNDAIKQQRKNPEDIITLLNKHRKTIVDRYQNTKTYLPLWLHSYIGQKLPNLRICCFIQPDTSQNILVSQAETNAQEIGNDTIFVLNRLTENNCADIAKGQMPSVAGYHYDGLLREKHT